MLIACGVKRVWVTATEAIRPGARGSIAELMIKALGFAVRFEVGVTD